MTQYRTPLDARTAAELPATVRSVARSQCLGPDVLKFWKALGFSVRYQMVKHGLQYEVEHAGHTVQVWAAAGAAIAGGGPLLVACCFFQPRAACSLLLPLVA